MNKEIEEDRELPGSVMDLIENAELRVVIKSLMICYATVVNQVVYKPSDKKYNKLLLKVNDILQEEISQDNKCRVSKLIDQVFNECHKIKNKKFFAKLYGSFQDHNNNESSTIK